MDREDGTRLTVGVVTARSGGGRGSSARFDGWRPPSSCGSTFHPTFHFLPAPSQRLATPRNAIQWESLKIANGSAGSAQLAKVEVVGSDPISRSQ